MAAKRERFKGYLNAAESLERKAAELGLKKVMRSEVIEYAEISGNRLNWVLNSALYVATCSEPESRTALVGRGSALFFDVAELCRLFASLHDPRSQAELVEDMKLDDDQFNLKYRRSKSEVFDGTHPVIETDNPCLSVDEK